MRKSRAVGDEAERNLGGIKKKNEVKRTSSHGEKSKEKEREIKNVLKKGGQRK